VPHEQLGTATSGVTFFRSIGGSFGTAIFGAIFANLLATNVIHALHLHTIPANLKSSLNAANPTSLAHLPPAIHAGVAAGMVHTIQTLFLIAVPVAVVGFALSWLLPDIELRQTLNTKSPEMPDARAALEDLQLAVERLTERDSRRELYARLAELAELPLNPASCWLLYRLADHPDGTLESVAARLQIDPHEIDGLIDELSEKGLVRTAQGPGKNEFFLTDDGFEAIDRLLDVRRIGFKELLGGWDPETHPEIGEMIRSLAHELLADEAKLLAAAISAQDSNH
jgi:DNA-binding MarR family transcriptional regulator